MDKVALGQVFLQTLRFPPVLHTHLFTQYRRCIILTMDSVLDPQPGGFSCSTSPVCELRQSCMQRRDRESERLDPQQLQLVFTSWTVTRTFLLSVPHSAPFGADKNLVLGLRVGVLMLYNVSKRM